MAVPRQVQVELVGNAAARRRFVEVPFVLHGGDPRWAPPLQRYERGRIHRRRNPFLRTGEAGLFLVRRAGRVIGRISAHVARPGDPAGWFGFFDVADDAEAAGALVAAAREWLVARRCTTMTGPASFSVSAEAGVLVAGTHHPGVTGRPWHPPWYAGHLAAAGLAPSTSLPSWHVDPGPLAVGAGPAVAITGRAGRPTVTGRYSDPALVLRAGEDVVAAVPDVAPALRAGGAVAAARLARRGGFDTCTVIVVEGDPARLVPAVAAAATSRGYRTIVTPWVPPDVTDPPTTIHQLFTTEL